MAPSEIGREARSHRQLFLLSEGPCLCLSQSLGNCLVCWESCSCLEGQSSAAASLHHRPGQSSAAAEARGNERTPCRPHTLHHQQMPFPGSQLQRSALGYQMFSQAQACTACICLGPHHVDSACTRPPEFPPSPLHAARLAQLALCRKPCPAHVLGSTFLPSH